MTTVNFRMKVKPFTTLIFNIQDKLGMKVKK